MSLAPAPFLPLASLFHTDLLSTLYLFRQTPHQGTVADPLVQQGLTVQVSLPWGGLLLLEDKALCQFHMEDKLGQQDYQTCKVAKVRHYRIKFIQR